MLKYLETKVVFQEIPDEISLAINITNCPCHCKGCHSKYLAQDIGELLTEEALFKLIERNKGISCVAFMGGDAEPQEVNYLAKLIRKNYPGLKVAWYSGRESFPSSEILNVRNFDYIKLGPYREEFGPLSSKRTNQRLYKIASMKDITYKFWKDN